MTSSNLLLDALYVCIWVYLRYEWWIDERLQKSSLLILLDLSAAFDTVNHQDPPVTLLVKGISGTTLQWLESYLSDRSFKVSWRGEVSKSQHLHYWGRPQAQFLDHFSSLSYMASLGSCHSETWLFISLLCWWHSLTSHYSWWSDDSCSHLSLSNRHFLLDEGPSPSTQPCQDRTACGFHQTHHSSQFHLPVRLINHNSFKNRSSSQFCQTSTINPECGSKINV